jgi:serine/threonine protein kinase
MSPERLIGHPYDSSGDIWSVGIMMLELWNKLYPFEDCCATPIDLLEELESESLFNIIESSNMHYKMQKLVKSMLYRDQNQRANCSDLLESKWFADCYVTDLEAAHNVRLILFIFL